VIRSRDYNLTEKNGEIPLRRNLYAEESIRFGVTYVEYVLHGVAVPVFYADYGSSGALLYATSANQANGVIWCTGEQIAYEWEGDRETALRCLHGEITEMNQYLQGDVYGYMVTYDDVSIESCWGLYGYEHVMAEAREEGASACRWEKEQREEAARQGIPTVKS
jgi:hypothetical protein